MSARTFSPVVFLAGLALIAAPVAQHIAAGQWVGVMFWVGVLVIGTDVATS